MLLPAVNFTGYRLIRRTLLVVMETLATHKTMYFKEVDKSVVLILFLSMSLDEKKSVNITYIIGSCSS